MRLWARLMVPAGLISLLSVVWITNGLAQPDDTFLVKPKPVLTPAKPHRASNEGKPLEKRPRGSLYVWLPLPEGWKSSEFVRQVLEGCGVSITPGTVFGERGEGYVRISITAPLERIVQAVERIGSWMKTWH